MDDKLRVYTVSPLKFFLFSNLIHLPLSPQPFSHSRINLCCTESRRCEMLSPSSSAFYWLSTKVFLPFSVFHGWMEHPVTSYERIYITTPIENQLSIYYFWCADHKWGAREKIYLRQRCLGTEENKLHEIKKAIESTTITKTFFRFTRMMGLCFPLCIGRPFSASLYCFPLSKNMS